MATPHELVTPQGLWRLGNPADKFFKSTAALSAPERYADASQAWGTLLENGAWGPGTGGGGCDRLVVELAEGTDDHALIAFKFYGAGSEGQVAVGRIWGILKTIETSDEFLGDYICDFEIVLGSKEIGSGSALPQDELWAAAITPTVDAAAFPDAADEVCIARFWAFTDVHNNGGVMGDYMGDVVVTLGAKAIHSGATVLPEGKLWAKRLQPTIDKTLFPGVRLVGEGGDAPVTMLFDGMGLKSFIVEIAMIVPTGSSADPAASAGVLWRVI